MLNFDRAYKLYLYKDRGHVNLCLRISPECVIGYDVDIDGFERILAEWDGPRGIELHSMDSVFCVEHKKYTPRPERTPASYVKFTVYRHGMSFNHRMRYDDMQGMRNEYFYQKHNRMHWDEDSR